MRFHAVRVFILMALFSSSPIARGADAHAVARSGQQMTPEERTALEEKVAKSPNDIESRTKILGYYFIKGRREPDAKSARQRHVVWLIENAPESEVLGLPYGQLDKALEPEGYERAGEAWLKIIKQAPNNLSVLKNASSFFLLQDRKLSEDLLLDGQTLAPKDPYWPGALGHLYLLGLSNQPDGPARQATAEKAYRQFEKAYDLSNAIEKDALLSYMAKTALAAGLLEDARAVAERMLRADEPASWNQGNQIHHGNLILGQIALRKGNVDEAKSRLLLAGKTTGSPQLNSFGPNMQLAKELLERSETAVVLEYFELCRKFWKSPHSQLDQWVEDVKANRIPNFGGNLAY